MMAGKFPVSLGFRTPFVRPKVCLEQAVLAERKSADHSRFDTVNYTDDLLTIPGGASCMIDGNSSSSSAYGDVLQNVFMEQLVV